MDAETQAQLLALERMTATGLRRRYAEVFGEATLVGNKVWLLKRIAWRLQAIAEGDLSQRARQRAAELANDADLRLNPPRDQRPEAPAPAAAPAPSHDPRLPPAGSVLTRKYKGRDIQVQVLADGFCYEGKTYSSLSAVAKAVSGQHQNGFLFFKLNKGGER